MLLGYWLLVFPAGILGMLLALKRTESARWLLGILILLNLASMMAVLYWSDLRFRVGIDLLLGCFAGWFYAELASRRRPASSPAIIENRAGRMGLGVRSAS